jgi:tmRNA-binding protein
VDLDSNSKANEQPSNSKKLLNHREEIIDTRKRKRRRRSKSLCMQNDKIYFEKYYPHQKIPPPGIILPSHNKLKHSN